MDCKSHARTVGISRIPDTEFYASANTLSVAGYPSQNQEFVQNSGNTKRSEIEKWLDSFYSIPTIGFLFVIPFTRADFGTAFAFNA
jgi:hypothetical protein